eukprot:1070308-Alexandrium_andersonii.AAC.1
MAMPPVRRGGRVMPGGVAAKCPFPILDWRRCDLASRRVRRLTESDFAQHARLRVFWQSRSPGSSPAALRT